MTTRPHPDWMRELDHTADVGVEVEAPSLTMLFERAAYAMFWLLSDIDATDAVVTIPVEIDASDRGELLVNWLSELNYRHQVDGLVFSHFTVEALDETHLVGAASGAAITGGRPEVFCELKAVTFHGLSIECEGGVCRARVIFDI